MTETFFGEAVGDAPTLRDAEKISQQVNVVRNRVVDALGDGLNELLIGLAEVVPTQVVLGLRVTEQVGLVLGFDPGASWSVMTACGMVRIEVGEPWRRRVEELRRALKDAVDEVDEHNNEYKHATPKSKLEAWRRLTE